jgi:glutamine synthetase
MGWFQEKLLVEGPMGPTFTVEVCPRTTLHRVVEEAKSVSNIEFLVGFESEFILLKSTSPIEVTNNYDWSVAAAFGSGSVEAKVLEEIADGIEIAGIELQMYHKEAAPGQYEVVTGPMAPLQAADALVLTREIIFNIANKHGLRATFTPRLHMTSSGGSATHAHISVHSSSSSRPTASGLAPHESSFLSSVLSHITAIVALTMPIKPSYARMKDGVWSGGTYVCWGTENRETIMRLCNANNPSSRNFEIRCFDGTANPYLALAAILGAGHAGIRDKAVLTMRDCAGGTGASEMSADERRALGITDRMPLCWEDARKNLLEDKLLGEVLGNDMVTKFLGVHETLASGVDSRCENENDVATLLVQIF